MILFFDLISADKVCIILSQWCNSTIGIIDVKSLSTLHAVHMTGKLVWLLSTDYEEAVVEEMCFNYRFNQLIDWLITDTRESTEIKQKFGCWHF